MITRLEILENMQSELDAIFTSLAQPVFISNTDSMVIKANQAAIDFFGFNFIDLTCDAILARLKPRTKDNNIVTKEEFIAERALKGESIKNEYFTFFGQNGEEKQCLGSAAPICRENKIIGSVVVWYDITQRKKVEAVIKEERNRFLSILDSMHDGIYICNRNFELEYTNPTFQAIFGLPQGRHCYEYIFDQLGPCSWCRVEEIGQCKTVKWEWTQPKTNNTYEIIESLLQNTDETSSYLKIFRDITSRKKEEDALKASHEKLEMLVNARTKELLSVNSLLNNKITELMQLNELLEQIFSNTNFLIAYLDTDFNFLRVNEAYARAGGHPPKYFQGKNHFELYPHKENQLIFQRVLATGKTYQAFAKPFSYPERSDGSITFWDWSLQPVKDYNGSVTSLIFFLVDVTERVKTEEKLLFTQQELNNAKRLSDIGTLAATVAHELRNPLGVIQTASYNIKRKNENPGINKHLARIEKKVAESDQIINNLLNYSRIKIPQLKRIQLYNFLNDCVSSAKRKYFNNHIKLIRNYDSLKELFISVDPFQIREVLNNVLNNAYEAFPDDKGTIEVRGSILLQENVEIEIIDNGCGINDEDIPSIFEPFFTKKSKGTGLGLTICKELIHLHSGRIEVESVLEKGTTIRITLPLTREDVDVAKENTHHR
jgi:PAS domain S-box-containing protein